ncbi:MAG: hypothetical protein SGPRY_003123, partial [Prymnesium sp.]
MEEEWPEWEAALSAFSLEAALHVTVAAGRITGGEAAVRAAFHKRAYHAYPLPRDAYPDQAAYELAVLTFRRICTAYLVLKDPERRRIYCSSGFDALRHSETFQQDDVFEADALEVFESFFEGTDEADREYLLLNGTDPPSDIEDWNDDEEEANLAGEDGWEEDEPPEMLSSTGGPCVSRVLLQEPPPRPPLALACGAFERAGPSTPADGVWADISSRTALPSRDETAAIAAEAPARPLSDAAAHPCPLPNPKATRDASHPTLDISASLPRETLKRARSLRGSNC